MYLFINFISSLKQFLEEDSLDMDSSNIPDIYKIITTIVGIMGIKLNDNDEMKLIKDTSNMCKTYIKSKEKWKK